MKKLLCLAALPFAAAYAASPVIHSFTAPVSSQIGTPVSLQWNVSNATSLSLNGVVVTGNSSRQVPYVNTTLVALSSTGWTYSNSNAVPVTDGNGKGWTDSAYVPGAEWKSTNVGGTALAAAPIGYDDATAAPSLIAAASQIDIDITPGNNAGATKVRIPTIYFRRTFTVTSTNLASYSGMQLQLQRDDGAAVYINGTLVARSNMKASTAPTSTSLWGHAETAQQDAAVPGGLETNTFYYSVPASVLKTGVNSLCVEVKQNSATSSDLRMNAGLIAYSLTETVATLSPQTAVWSYLDDGSNQGTAWTASGFDASTWPSGPALFGYKDTAPTTRLSFGADAAAKPLRYTFRKKFNIANKAAITSLLMNVRYVDGAVLYLNGTRISPDSLAVFLGFNAGPVADDTIPPQHAATAYEAVTLTPATFSNFFNALTDGENILAADVRISTAADLEMYFDLRLRDNTVAATPVTLITEKDTWKYLDNGQFISPDWNSPAYDDSGWASGKGTLGFDTIDTVRTPATPISYGPDIAAKYITTYFRRKITLTSQQLAAADFLVGELKLDDGCVIYVNGTPVLTQNLPATVTYTTTALTAVNDAANGVYSTIFLDKAPFVAGENTIAVEVHQQAANSSDVYFDFALKSGRKASAVSYTLAATNTDGTTSATTTATLTDFDLTRKYAVVPITGTPAAATLQWNASGAFSDDQVASAGNDYQVAGILGAAADLQVNTYTNAFLGKSLTLATGGELRLASATFSAPNLVFKGGAVRVPSVSTAVTLADPFAVEGLGTLDGTSTGKSLVLSGAVSGTGIIVVDSGGASATVDSGLVSLTGASSTFSGLWRVEKGTFKVAHAASLGANPSLHLSGANFTGTLRPATLDLDENLTSTGTLYLNGPAQKVILDQTLTFASVVLSNSTVLPVGSYAPGSADLLALPPADQTLLAAALDNGGGTFTGNLVVTGAANPDSDADGIPDAYEIATFGSLSQTAEGDFDGDGFSNLAEYLAGTNPANATSTFHATGATAGATAFSFNFPSVPGKTYTVQFKNSLNDAAWTVLNASLPANATGSTTQVTDNFGSNTRRFYRVILN